MRTTLNTAKQNSTQIIDYHAETIKNEDKVEREASSMLREAQKFAQMQIPEKTISAEGIALREFCSIQIRHNKLSKMKGILKNDQNIISVPKLFRILISIYFVILMAISSQ